MTFWTDRRVVITGGEGFIGSTSSTCSSRPAPTSRRSPTTSRTASTGSSPTRCKSGAVKVVAGDIRDHGQVQDVVADVDTVFHLAALIGIPYSYEAPDSYVQANVVGTHNVVAAARRHGIRRVVTTSTSEVYGSALTVPISEDHPLQPQSPYSASKIGGDMMAHVVLPVVRDAGDDRPAVQHVRPPAVGAGGDPGDPPAAALRGQGDQARPAHADPRLHVLDRHGVRIPGRRRARRARSAQTLNLGTGREVSVGDLVSLLIKVSGKDAEIVQDPARIRPEGSEVMRLLADNSRVRELTGWEPAVSLEDGLARTSRVGCRQRAARRLPLRRLGAEAGQVPSSPSRKWRRQSNS